MLFWGMVVIFGVWLCYFGVWLCYLGGMAVILEYGCVI